MRRNKSAGRSSDSSQNPLDFLKTFSEKSKDFLSSFIPDDSDLDRKEKQEVYTEIARILQKRFNEPLRNCIGATYAICQETDPFFLEDSSNYEHDEKFELFVASATLSINIRYEPLQNSRSYRRQIEVFFSDKGDVTVSRTDSTLDWDFLPPDVRENKLKYGQAISTFELYSQES